MNTSKANTNKPWMSNEHDMPVLETEEMWSQRMIDEVITDLFNEMDEDERDRRKTEK